MLRKIITALTFVAAAFFLTAALAEDAIIADPDHYAVEFENDRIRIIRIKYGPGEKSVMHTHGPNAWTIVNGGQMRMTLPDGTSTEIDMQPGDIGWSDSDEHLPENLGDSAIEVVLVELKD
jgi:quercetin dioxygenase-like cupin family protein